MRLGAERLCSVPERRRHDHPAFAGEGRSSPRAAGPRRSPVINLDCDDDLEIPPMRVPTCQLQHGFGDDARDIMPYPAQDRACRPRPNPSPAAAVSTSSPPAPPTRPATSRSAASTSPGWNPRRSSTPTPSSVRTPTARAAPRPAPPSLTGRIPCWGNHHRENRYGTHLIETTLALDGFQDWGLLGYFAGDVVQEERPVVIGELGSPDLADLKHFGAAAASSGGVEIVSPAGPDPRRADARGRLRRPLDPRVDPYRRSRASCRLRVAQLDRGQRGRRFRAAGLPARFAGPDRPGSPARSRADDSSPTPNCG